LNQLTRSPKTAAQPAVNTAQQLLVVVPIIVEDRGTH
jgi:hypothetical protein